MTSRHAERGHGVLVVPDDLVVDESVVARLERRLLTASPDVHAIVAPIGSPPPGSSFRTHAQRLGGAAFDGMQANDQNTPIAGAALVRQGTAFSVDGRCVRVDGLSWTDTGTVTHDPNVAPHTLAPAQPVGTPVFPRSPLVVFLACEPDLGRATWARDMVNSLVHSGTEARLATASVPAPPHLTTPCAPTASTIDALGPDIVVTLDDAALDLAPTWCRRRSTVIVHHTGERRLDSEIQPWRLGVELGRVRAFIGSAIRPDDLAGLCSRLTSGPMPMPPTADLDDLERPIPSPIRREPQRARRVTLVETSDVAEGRLERVLSEAAASGWHVERVRHHAIDAATDADVAVLSHDADPAVAEHLVRARRERGRRTVIDLGELTALTPALAALAADAGAATAATRPACAALASQGVVARYLPTIVTRDRLDELRAARTERNTDDDTTRLVVHATQVDAEILAAVTEATSTVLERFPQVEVEMTTAWGFTPAATIGRPLWLMETAYAGIPAAFAAGAAGDIDDDLVCRWHVDSPRDVTAWVEVLASIVEAGDVAAERLATRGDLLFGPKAAQSIVNRAFGWGAHRLDAR